MLDALKAALFSNDAEKTYAVVDGASCEELLDKLDDLAPRYFCLYAGELEPDVEEVAPYLVELLPGHPFTEWYLANGIGKHWGIFALSPVGLRALRGHFRKFLLVADPQGKKLYFRYYDPRVLRLYLPTCTGEEIRFLFGPVTAYLAEMDDAVVARWDHANGTLNPSPLLLER